jgi:hypothetical protein
LWTYRKLFPYHFTANRQLKTRFVEHAHPALLLKECNGDLSQFFSQGRKRITPQGCPILLKAFLSSIAKEKLQKKMHATMLLPLGNSVALRGIKDDFCG